MRFLFSVIGVAVVLWWTFVWRFDGKTPAQYATVLWHSPKVQQKLKELAQELPKELPRELPWQSFGTPAENKQEQGAQHEPKPQPNGHGQKPGHKAPRHEGYTEKDRRTLDALVDRVQKSRND